MVVSQYLLVASVQIPQVSLDRSKDRPAFRDFIFSCLRRPEAVFQPASQDPGETGLARFAETETPKASTGMGRGYPLPHPTKGSGGAS